MPSFMI